MSGGRGTPGFRLLALAAGPSPSTVNGSKGQANERLTDDVAGYLEYVGTRTYGLDRVAPAIDVLSRCRPLHGQLNERVAINIFERR